MRVVCKYCNKKFASDAKLAFHNTYFCGPNARMTAGQAKMGRKNHGSRNTGGSSKKEQKKSAKKGKKKKGESSSESEWEPSDEDDDEDDDDEDGWDDDGGAFEVSAAAAKTKGKDKCHPCSNTGATFTMAAAASASKGTAAAGGKRKSPPSKTTPPSREKKGEGGGGGGEDLWSLKKEDLKEKCRQMGLAVGGNNDELIARLREATGADLSELKKEDLKERCRKRGLAVGGNNDELIARLKEAMEAALLELKKEDLKERCRAMGLAVGGNNEALIERLKEAIQGGKSGKGGGKRTAVPDDDGDDDDDDDDEEDEDEDGFEEVEGGWKDKKLSAMAKAAKRRTEDAAMVAKKSILHRIGWQRIVLDEAHAIKDRRCSTAQGTFALHAYYRWCLSGTPLQNRVGEFYSLVTFLRVDPYAYYFCKGKNKDGSICDCKCREYFFDAEHRGCQYCGHSPLQHYSLFNQTIVNPIKKFGFVGAGRQGFLALKRGVLDRVLLRRTKAGRADEMVLPPKVVTIEANFLDARESDFYQGLYTQSQAALARTSRRARCSTTTRMSSTCSHGSARRSTIRTSLYTPHRGEAANAESAANNNGGANGAGLNGVCGLCFEDANDGVLTGCGHLFCRDCMRDYIETLDADASSQCPTCHQPLSVDLSVSAPSKWPIASAPRTTLAAPTTRRARRLRLEEEVRPLLVVLLPPAVQSAASSPASLWIASSRRLRSRR